MEVILTQQTIRVISKNLIVQYKNIIYQIQTKRPVSAMKKKKVTIIENNLGKVEIIYKGNKLEYTIFKKQPKVNSIISNKELNNFLDDLIKNKVKKGRYKSSANHPWKRPYKTKILQPG